VFNADGTVLMEVQSLERNGNYLEFRGMVMGAMPVKGHLTPGEARGALKLICKHSMIWFLLTFLFRPSAS
jgi:hypothetical protein